MSTILKSARERLVGAWFSTTGASHYYLTRWLFLRLLGVVFLIAFLSFWVQIDGLVGSNGIEPAAPFLDGLRQHYGGPLPHRLPTLCWISASDVFLHALCIGGMVLSLALIGGIGSSIVLFVLWLVYLSLFNVSNVFLGFQWDLLLLETGFAAMFFAPCQVIPGLARERRLPSRAALWLLRLLLFRLMFASGIVKLIDPNWINWSALTYHYETQPLPTVLGWCAHHLPAGINMASVPIMFFIEVCVPFGIFGPRIIRGIAGVILIIFQALIIATGNYAFFNLLTIILCVTLFDDAQLRRAIPSKLKKWLQTPEEHRPTWTWLRVMRMTAVAALVVLGAATLLLQLAPEDIKEDPVYDALVWVSPYRVVNSYGLFAHMTTTRPEIIIEGSDDGETWKPYEFSWKPGDVKRRPSRIAPHQPRLDWQMWFAALGTAERNPWFMNLMVRLLQGQPEVLALFESNPFSEKPPKYVRAMLYEYTFSDIKTFRETGAWWERQLLDEYVSPLSLT